MSYSERMDAKELALYQSSEKTDNAKPRFSKDNPYAPKELSQTLSPKTIEGWEKLATEWEISKILGLREVQSGLNFLFREESQRMVLTAGQLAKLGSNELVQEAAKGANQAARIIDIIVNLPSLRNRDFEGVTEIFSLEQETIPYTQERLDSFAEQKSLTLDEGREAAFRDIQRGLSHYINNATALSVGYGEILAGMPHSNPNFPATAKSLHDQALQIASYVTEVESFKSIDDFHKHVEKQRELKEVAKQNHLPAITK